MNDGDRANPFTVLPVVITYNSSEENKRAAQSDILDYNCHFASTGFQIKCHSGIHLNIPLPIIFIYGYCTSRHAEGIFHTLPW